MYLKQSTAVRLNEVILMRERKTFQQERKATAITALIIFSVRRNNLDERKFLFTHHLQLSNVLLTPNVVLILWPHGSCKIIGIHNGVDEGVQISQEGPMATCKIKM
jgi:hypothetical protein